MINSFKLDLYRHYGNKKITIKRRIFMPLELKYLYNLRKCQNTNSKIIKLYYMLKIKKLTNKTHIQIPHNTRIGDGFYISHLGKIIINPNSILGKNINISTGVTIGQENRGKRKGTPVIGNNVWIGTNAVIVGNINIGNDVLIAPLSYVNFDVPDHSIVIGNPGKIIPKENATKEYINNTI